MVHLKLTLTNGTLYHIKQFLLILNFLLSNVQTVKKNVCHGQKDKH